MENRLFSEFNIYDQIGILLVGSIAILILYLDAFLLDYTLPKLELQNTIVWFIVAYFLGHIIQAVANIFIKEKKENFNDKEKRILDIGKELFKIEGLSYGDIWNLCYMMSLANDVTGQISSFNAYYSLYRGWLVIFTLESFFLFIYLVSFSSNLLSTLLLIISIILSVLFYRRAKRYYSYLRAKVLQTFIIIKTLK